MAYYIDKDALVAEIEKIIKINKECMLGLRNLDYYQGKVDALNDTISSIDTLEVREVDLDKLGEIARHLIAVKEHTEDMWMDYVDYCNKHHIDYRNLISKGLALEASEGIYN